MRKAYSKKLSNPSNTNSLSTFVLGLVTFTACLKFGIVVKKFKIDFRLDAGDIFCFNNRRVLHGRTEFDPNSGNRHLQGYYIERDEIIGRLNYFNNIKV